MVPTTGACRVRSPPTQEIELLHPSFSFYKDGVVLVRRRGDLLDQHDLLKKLPYLEQYAQVLVRMKKYVMYSQESVLRPLQEF
jgi:hypothetical protein